MLFFILYSLFLIGLSYYDAKKNRTAESFFVNNRNSGFSQVGISIVASCVGASATIGMVGMAFEVGFPAFIWLGSGAVGLTLMLIFLVKKTIKTKALTMPEMVETYLGKGLRPLVSGIIVLAWLAILAAQFTALGKVVAILLDISLLKATCLGTFVIAIYACLGGQASVIRSDTSQYFLLLLGLLLTFIYLFNLNPEPVLTMPLELLNDKFTISEFSYFMLIIGGSYVVCPMLMGRFLSARDVRTALWGGGFGILALLITALLIVLIGVAARGLVLPGTVPDLVLTSVLQLLPPGLNLLLLLSLLGAILSSADSCLLTAATVFCNDLLKNGAKVRTCRIVTFFLAGLGLLIALQGKSILSLLLMANEIYVCGVVAPVFVAMLCYDRVKVDSFWASLAVWVGGICGFISAFNSDEHFFSYLGIFLSLSLCLWGTRRGGTRDINSINGINDMEDNPQGNLKKQRS